MEKIRIKILFLPHFEVGEMSGDFPGEAQYFYEEYLSDGEVFDIPGGHRLYCDTVSGAALCVTGSGKNNTAISLTSILCDGRFDFGGAYIMGVGCAGGAAGYSVPGDVCIVTGVCDSDLGHTADPRDTSDKNVKWYCEPAYTDICAKRLNRELWEEMYGLTKDMKLETTDVTRRVMERNFGGEEWAARAPKVILGSALSGDNYWKGKYDHDRADYICGFYGSEHPYAVSEMEDISIAVTADKFGMLDRVVIIRSNVNPDVYIDGATPESLWGGGESFNSKIENTNAETLDIFVPAMRNLFAVGKVIADRLLMK